MMEIRMSEDALTAYDKCSLMLSIAKQEKPDITSKEYRDIREAAYTFTEGNPYSIRFDAELMIDIYLVVKLALEGKLTEEMKL